jgi:hypothetical protein
LKRALPKKIYEIPEKTGKKKSSGNTPLKNELDTIKAVILASNISECLLSLLA